MLNREVIKHTLDLLETMEEGVRYIKQKLGDLKIEATINILTDTINAFLAIEEGIIPLLKELSKNKILEETNKLRVAFDILVKEYESNRGQKAFEITQFTLEPAFKNWKEELEGILKPYIVS